MLGVPGRECVYLGGDPTLWGRIINPVFPAQLGVVKFMIKDRGIGSCRNDVCIQEQLFTVTRLFFRQRALVLAKEPITVRYSSERQIGGISCHLADRAFLRWSIMQSVVAAPLCDSWTIVNQAAKSYLMAIKTEWTSLHTQDLMPAIDDNVSDTTLLR